MELDQSMKDALAKRNTPENWPVEVREEAAKLVQAIQRREDEALIELRQSEGAIGPQIPPQSGRLFFYRGKEIVYVDELPNEADEPIRVEVSHDH